MKIYKNFETLSMTDGDFAFNANEGDNWYNVEIDGYDGGCNVYGLIVAKLDAIPTKDELDKLVFKYMEDVNIDEGTVFVNEYSIVDGELCSKVVESHEYEAEEE